jgi:hypothetical protein
MTAQAKEHYRSLRNWFIWLSVACYIIAIIIAFDSAISTAVVVVAELVGLALDLFGCYYWVRYKGLNKWLYLLGVISWIGWLILMTLKDKTVTNSRS